jgi:uncharacterized protein (TIGR03435 family)
MKRLLMVAILIASGIRAEESVAPAFEVAWVKPSTPQSRTLGIYTFPGGRITGENRTLRELIEEAFNVQTFQISGGANWVREERYDFEAKPPASSEASRLNPRNSKLPPNEEQRRMLQTLLVDRFHLKYHRETKEGAVYLLLKGNNKLKLQDPKDKNDFPWVGSNRGGAINGDGIAGINISMPLVAQRLSRYVGRPVLEQTGLEGSFDFKFEYPLPSDGQRPDVTGSVITSLQGIGLKLQASKGPVETIVIDQVERPPAN